MAKKVDLDKLALWKQRLQRHRASGLTVSSFCQQENVSPANFYYWSRRTREAESNSGSGTARTGGRASAAKASRKPAVVVAAAAMERSVAARDNCPVRAPIEVRLHDSLRVFIPADCDQPMKLVSLLAHAMGVSSAPMAKEGQAFQQVLLGAR
jgi:hypothetical protein